MNCSLCKWLCGWLCKDSPVRSDVVWEKSEDWERAESNEYDLWEEEPDRERVEKANTLLDSDPQAAFLELVQLASAGSVWSMLTLAYCYEWGRGTECDLILTEHWYVEAMNAGSWMATLHLARVLQKQGRFAECFEILEDGVRSNFTPSFFWLAWYRLRISYNRKTFGEILPNLIRASEEGHPAAQLYLSRWMMLGKFGFRRIPEGFRRAGNFISSMRSAESDDVTQTQTSSF